MPIGVDWPEEVYKVTENVHSIHFDNANEWLLHETGIDLIDPTEHGELRLKLFSEDDIVELNLKLYKRAGGGDYRFSVVGPREVWFGNRSSRIKLEEFFYENPPVIWFANGSSLEGNQFTSLKSKYLPYDRSKIRAWDWAGINLNKESQGMYKDRDSIQFRVIAQLRKEDYDVIIDDDGAGEAADV